MKKYVMFCSSSDSWFQLALDLLEKNIAKPSLWLADDLHYSRACSTFGKAQVKKLSELRYSAPVHKNISYDGTHSQFLFSQEYKNAKDVCMKMMDRLDDVNMFSRIDREVWFHLVCIWALNNFLRLKPNFVIMSEAPHNHAQYAVFAICDYLNIPILKFSVVTPVPILFSYIYKNKVYEKLPYTNQSETKNNLIKELNDYIDESFFRLKNRNTAASHLQALQQKSNSMSFKVNKLNIFLKDCFRFLKYPKKLLSKEYDSINPFGLGPIKRHYFMKRRAILLKREFGRNSSDLSRFDRSYIFFPLHYEPERTTLPDGGEYQDQFKLICALRAFFPEKMQILIKEHPSQFLSARTGFKGRSPLFYSLLKNINNVKVVSENATTQDLIKNAEFVATISGTAGFEAALLGKNVILFGEAWFKGMPNVHLWEQLENFKDLSNKKVSSIKEIKKFFIDEVNKSGLVGFQNLSSAPRYKQFLNNNFFEAQRADLFNVTQKFIAHHVT